MVGYNKSYEEKEVWASGGRFKDVSSIYTSGTSSAVGTGSVNALRFRNSSFAGSINSVVGIGSPVVWDYMVQAGSDTLSSNTKLVSYPTAFGGVPIVTLTNYTLVAGALGIGNTGNVGSFQASGASASDKFMWIAVGKKA